MSRSALTGWACEAGGDHLRLQTPFRYPDGGWIEVYVETYGNDVVVTDFGEASRFLETHGIDPNRGATRKRLIELAIELGGATASDGAVEIHVGNPERVLEAALRLSQIVTRIGDLVLGARGVLGTTFTEEVEDFVRIHLPASDIQRNARVLGKATEHSVDLLVQMGEARPAAIEALAATSATSARSQLAYTVQKFADIWHSGTQAPTLIALVDDTADVWTRELRLQLQNFSQVLDWEQRDELLGWILEPERASMDERQPSANEVNDASA